MYTNLKFLFQGYKDPGLSRRKRLTQWRPYGKRTTAVNSHFAVVSQSDDEIASVEQHEHPFVSCIRVTFLTLIAKLKSAFSSTKFKL